MGSTIRSAWANGRKYLPCNPKPSLGRDLPAGRLAAARTTDGNSDPSSVCGNLSVSCLDRSAADRDGKSPVEVPQGPVEGSEHVARGGSWSTPGILAARHS